MPPRIPDKRRAKIMDTILKRLMDGESLRSICEDASLPNRQTILEWMNGDGVLAATVTRARLLQADALDDDTADTIQEVRDGTLDANQARVIIWANQWRQARMAPKRYGDKIDLKHSGNLTIGIKRNERVEGE